MNKQRNVKVYLNDIYELIEKGISFLNNMEYEEFQKE